jgi:hypothetical protein
MTRREQPKISNKLVRLSPLELYKLQVKNNFDSIRYEQRNMSYTPTQLGGLQGQRILLESPSVVEIIEFEVS